MDQLSLLKKTYAEIAERRDAAFRVLEAAHDTLNNARTQLKIAAAQLDTEITKDEAVAAEKKLADDTYNNSLVRPQALLTTIDALVSEQIETARLRSQAKAIAFVCRQEVSKAERQLAVAQINFDRVSAEAAQFDGEIRRISSALTA